MSVRLILSLNALFLAGLAGYLAWRVLSPRWGEERPPANQTPFHDDETLEGRRLERVLGWGLFFAAIVAVALPLYWLREPTRQSHSVEYFDEGAVERGRTLFAAPGVEGYDGVLSLQCASCHGADGAGGSASTVIDTDGPEGPEPPQRYTWRAPALNTVLLRFQEDPECADDRQRSQATCEVSQIIIHGRPGTPMPAFGIAGGGAENNQTINDVVAYLRTIQLDPDDAKRQATSELAAAKRAAQRQVDTAGEALASAQTDLDEARSALDEVFASLAGASDDERRTQCEDLATRAESGPEGLDPDQAEACSAYLAALEAQEGAADRLDWAQRWAALRDDVGDGQLLFELNCARCHTSGWSVFDPTEPGATAILGEPGGGGGTGGGIGFNLRAGAPERRFGPGEAGVTLMTQFVSDGSNANEQYGRNGVGSGRMPGFANLLTAEQIEAIVRYVRDEIDTTTYDVGSAGNTADDATTEG